MGSSKASKLALGCVNAQPGDDEEPHPPFPSLLETDNVSNASSAMSPPLYLNWQNGECSGATEENGWMDGQEAEKEGRKGGGEMSLFVTRRPFATLVPPPFASVLPDVLQCKSDQLPAGLALRN